MKMNDSGLVHVVHFWLKDGVDAEGREEFQEAMRALAEIPTVNHLLIGPPSGTESRGVVDNSFDYSLIVFFDDVAGHDVYQEHPIHLKFVAEQEAKFDRVRVRDNDVMR